MRITLIAIVFFGALFIAGCKSSGSDTAIATDMCGCFNMLKDSLPAEAISVFQKASVAGNPQETYEKEMRNLKPEIALKVAQALMSTTKKGSPVNDCLKKMDEKYKTNTNDQQEMGKRMITALKDKKDCEIMLALMRMNVKK
jgi:hypothetical protein